MKKLLFITTGGTIACGAGEEGLLPSKDANALIGGVRLPCPADVLDLYSIDSTDTTPAHFRLLHDALTERLPLYDGIVILHGTDTMAYTGAVLDLTADTDKPVILTGSMLSPDEPMSDAADNIRFAALTALGGEQRGVKLAFAGRVIGGADIAKVSSREKDAFRAYSGFSPGERYPFPKAGGAFPRIVKLSPFTLASEIEGIEAPAAVIESYGAGGLPKGELLEAIRRLAGRIPVVLTTPCLGGTSLDRYEVGRRALAAGLIEGGGMSTACAAVWLWIKENR